MGKRSTSTTKSGKFMNPTDQARKEARRRELKKNKKQRLLVRQAVLKGKDIANIFTELEKIDQMEFNPVQSAPLSEKVLKEKRKKLRDTLNRVMRLYEKEDPTQWTQIKALEVQYEKRRAELIIYCESVKHAQSVNLEEIPLPNLGDIPGPDGAPSTPHGILKKMSAYGDSSLGASLVGRLIRRAPGVPSVPPPELHDIWDEGDGLVGADVVEPGVPGIDDQEEAMDGLPPYHTYYQFIRPPPDLDVDQPMADEQGDSDDDEDDDQDEGDDEEDEGGNSDDMEHDMAPKMPMEPVETAPVPKPTSLQQRMLAIAGQDVDTFIKEMEVVHRQKEIRSQVNLEQRLARLDRGEAAEDQPESGDYASAPAANGAHLPPHQMPFHPAAMGFQRPPAMPAFPPPPPHSLPAGYAAYGQPPARLPPGPPPRMPQGMPPRHIRPPGMPPPPPPGIRMGARPPMASVGPAAAAAVAGVTGVASVAKTGAAAATGSKPMTVIEAKPQMRNLSADLTRFVPTTLKLKKDAPSASLVVKKAHDVRQSAAPRIEWRIPQSSAAASAGRSAQPGASATASFALPAGSGGHAPQTKDDAYSQFMKEMDQLIN